MKCLRAFIATLLLALGLASGAHAQSFDDPDGLLAFSLWGLTSSPGDPRDFDYVVFLIAYGSSEIDDPFMLNDLNLTFESGDDTVDPLPL
jgi:hypothetical protein